MDAIRSLPSYKLKKSNIIIACRFLVGEMLLKRFRKYCTKIITWVDNSTTINIYDIITKKQETFKVKTIIP